MSWKSIRFGDFVESSPNIKLKKGELFSFIPMEDIDPKQKFANSSYEREYTGGGAKFANGDTIFARITPCLEHGKIAKVVNLKTEIGFGSTEFIVFRAKEGISDPDFIYYLAKSNNIKGPAIKSMVGSSGRQRARLDVIEEIFINVPDINTQHRIASILSAYDFLIENNRRRIQLLEQSARMLYREWFVHLRFPGHEHVRIIDGVSEGWRYDKLQEVADINAISLNNGFQGEIEYIDISSVTTGQINDTTFYDYDDAPGRARRVVRHGDIIWSCVRPNRESHAIIWHPHKNLIASTGFAVITPIKIPTSYIYQAITTKDFVGYLSNNARGVAYPAVTGKDFEAADILIPTHNLLEQFDEVVKPTIEQINVLNTHNEKLIEACDILHSRLMNGEITV